MFFLEGIRCVVKILLIGNADSVWIKEYCDYILHGEKYEVTIFSLYNSVYKNFYRDNNIKIIIGDSRVSKGRIGRLFSKVKDVMCLRKNKYDYIHVHYCSLSSLRLMCCLRGCKIVTFYGSDIFRVSIENIKKISFYLYFAKKIVLLNYKMCERFENSKYLRGMLNKVSVFDFGFTNLYYIKNILGSVSKEECKNKFKIASDKIVIAIGYSKSEAHQHTKVLDALKELPEDIKNQICLLFHMSYGECSDNYWNEFQKKLKEIQCQYVIVEEYLTEYDIAYLRLAVDVYINAQLTDALSATMMEYFYAGGMVINAGWLKYEELDKMGIEYKEFHEFRDLPSVLIECINEKEHTWTGRIRDHIWESYSWEYRKDDWLRLYEDNT